MNAYINAYRAVALNDADLTEFVIRHALRAAKAVIQQADIYSSERDSLRVLDLLDAVPLLDAPLTRLLPLATIEATLKKAAK